MATGLLFNQLNDLGSREASKNISAVTTINATLHNRVLTLTVTVSLDNVTFENNVDPSGIMGSQAFFAGADFDAVIASIKPKVCFFRDLNGKADFQIKLEASGGKVGGPGEFDFLANK